MVVRYVQPVLAERIQWAFDSWCDEVVEVMEVDCDDMAVDDPFWRIVCMWACTVGELRWAMMPAEWKDIELTGRWL